MKKTEPNSLRIGLFGATFDPPHYGHLIAADYAADELELDEVLMIPASLNPLKQEHLPAPPNLRLEMIQAAVVKYPRFRVSDIELKRGGVSYTIDTVQSLLKDYRSHETEFFLLLGADAAADFHLWRDYQRLAEMCQLSILSRPGFDMESTLAKLPLPAAALNMPMIDISSTLIRNRLRQGKSINFLTPPEVVEIIECEKLYIEPK